MMSAGAALAALIGFGWLALSKNVHWRQVRGYPGPDPSTRRYLRLSGTAALLVSGALCFAVNRPSMAVLVWVMLLSAAAPLIALTLAWRAPVLRHIWPWGGSS